MITVWKIFSIGFRQILRDGMLFILLPAPFLLGAALRFIIPYADGILSQQLNLSLFPWYPISDAFLLTMTPVMIAMVCAFIVLDERDESIGVYYSITPSAGWNYLIARIGLPMVWAFASSVIVVLLFGLAVDNIPVILTVSVISTLQGIIFFMLLVTLAGNKVEGLALSKITNILSLGLFVPWFLEAPYRYLFGFLPSFWIGQMIHFASQFGQSIPLSYIAMGVLSWLIWTIFLSRWFLQRT
ncbi:hypothetical protein [Candidatus Contubernalis alkaliaceticus]|uniref:hypothetical protein n=1 Tax=Candidatus Contubernalis alkaliaceticus TaxID=338645 RepID=UPI001F4C2006|nr:hypothetical protein [Candidatus Contubernalis alkalaceticus]UNC92003.1 hypothetical protein HUE98_07770 [Candidatus Contubernalis alkalaceticus]